MKQIYLKKLMILLGLFFALTVYSQCVVYDDIPPEVRRKMGISEAEFLKNKSKPLQNASRLHSSKTTITPKKFRVNFWAVMNDEGTEGVRIYYDMALKYVKQLNEAYKEHQICFVLNGNGVLKSTAHMHGQNHSWLASEGKIKNAYADDAINIYVAKTIILVNGGSADGVTTYLDNAIAIKEENLWWMDTTLVHEMGHVLNLIHTHGDTNDPPNGSMANDPNCEHVTRDPNDPNYNALTAGDMVYDTAADPGLYGSPGNFYNVDSNCKHIKHQTDCQGTPYSLDSSVLDNIMSYGPRCLRLFTQGQAERMHQSIDNADPLMHPVKRALVTPNNDKNFDMMVRNSEVDLGVEPDHISTNFWSSPDIWIRNVNDDSPYHDNPLYGIGPNYAKIRIVNKGCSPTDGRGKVKLYWIKAGTSLPIAGFEGNLFHNGYPLGGLIGEADLPVLNSYQEHIVTIPWNNIPDPARYSSLNEPWHFCLLAKIESPTDISPLPESDGYSYLLLNTNNIALKNVSVLKTGASNSGKIHVGNFRNTPKKFKLRLKNELSRFNTNIFNEAEVSFKFDSKLWNIWASNGFQGTNFQMQGENAIKVNENTEIILDNFPPNDYGLLDVRVNFLTANNSENEEFGFHVEHWDIEEKKLLGGEFYQVSKQKRELFRADAAQKGNTLEAVPINEPAIYKWYDSRGTLLHTGERFEYHSKDSKVILEVTAELDGFKDYKTLSISPENSYITTIYPNPAKNTVNIGYKKMNCSHAYFMLIDSNSRTVSNYIIDKKDNTMNINISQYPGGTYRLVLVCDNAAVESRNLIIQ